MLGFSGETVIFLLSCNCLVTGKFCSVGYTADGSLSDKICHHRVCFMKSAVEEQCAAKEY
jgi:hypothetical protein